MREREREREMRAKQAKGHAPMTVHFSMCRRGDIKKRCSNRETRGLAFCGVVVVVGER